MLQSSFVRSLFAALLVLSGLLITPFTAQASQLTATQQTVILSINDVVAIPGSTGTLQIDLDNVAGSSVVGGEITISYDSTTGLSLTNPQLIGRASNFLPIPLQSSENEVRFSFYHPKLQAISPGTDAILELDYTVAANASGSTALAFTETLLYDSAALSITTNTNNGLFTVDNGSTGNARVYVEPASSSMNVGGTQILRVMVDPGNAEVNGVQVNAKVNPTYLTLLDVQGNTAQMNAVLDPIVFNASTGTFSYAAGRLGSTVTTAFEILRLEVRAVATTSGTAVEFLNTFPKTDVNGPGGTDGSVMDSAENGIVVIDIMPTTANLIGEIGLQGRPNGSSPSRAVPVTIQLFSVGGTTPLSTFNITLDQNARFIQGGITPGTYDVRMVNSHTLASRAKNVTLNGGNNNIYLGPLREGDVSQDNEVRTNDFSLLANAYNLCDGSPGFDDRTDLNEDGCTDIDDFSLLSGNMNTQGDIEYDVNNPPPLPLELATATMALQMPNIEGKIVGETFEATIVVDPNGSRVNGATANIRFDPANLEVVGVTLLAEQQLPYPLQEGQIDNDTGTVSFSKGKLGGTVSEQFELAVLTLRLKQETDGASLVFSDDFPATNVTGKEGSVLAETVVEEAVTRADTGTNTEGVPPALSDNTEGQAAEDSSEIRETSTDERVFLPLILR